MRKLINRELKIVCLFIGLSLFLLMTSSCSKNTGAEKNTGSAISYLSDQEILKRAGNLVEKKMIIS
ncbi:MAG: hypothetical protein LBI13_03590 [Streptococcaceae bacterium]|nr:hypothetical protein [Streptococcaceae bacterium]